MKGRVICDAIVYYKWESIGAEVIYIIIVVNEDFHT